MNKLMECDTSKDKIYRELRRNYLVIYLMANFIDWLQGPYLYKLYSNYGYEKKDISIFYISGFISSAVSGIFIGHYADKFGRKKFCLFYFIASIISCLFVLDKKFLILFIGRIFGGISTSILFSTFESWYVSQHLLQYNIPNDLIGITMVDSAFYNSLIAIIAGWLSSLLVDNYNFGPVSPFILTIPISLISIVLCNILWMENVTASVMNNKSPIEGLEIIFQKSNRLIIYLGLIQTLFETVMYIFIFLWTSILTPIDPSNGIIFGGFMLCIIIGSACHSIVENNFRISRDILLLISIIVALFSIIISTIGIHIQMQIEMEIIGTYICLISFLLYELSVGLYYPAISYFRSIILPECYRSSITNWYRLPSNILICIVLLYITIALPDTRSIFLIAIMALSISLLYCIEFIKIYYRDIYLNPDCYANNYQ